MTDKDESSEDYQEMERATRLTTDTIRQLINDHQADNASAAPMLSVAERNELIDEIAQIIPAGNVINFIFSGLVNAKKGEMVGGNTGRAHMNALLKGISYMRDNMVYRMMFAGPATILAGYNMMLQLAGNDPNEYLPDGAWQFYVEFGLREDAAHHQNETIGFQQRIRAAGAILPEDQQLAAWMLAACSLLQDYDALLSQRWEENIRLLAIEETTGLTGLHRKWQTLQPFAAPTYDTNLIAHRTERFKQFCNYHLSWVSKQQWEAFVAQWYPPEKQDERGRRQRAYVRQLTLNRYLEPGEYSDERYPIMPEQLKIAVIYQGAYYLLPVSALTPPHQAYQIARGILNGSDTTKAEVDTILAATPRSAQLRLRSNLDPSQRQDIEQLRKAPIILNWDVTNSQQPLAQIRDRKRGIGDHALTLFRTDTSTVFDFSHIFFDGPWAMAVAEMLTNEALRHLYLVNRLPSAPIDTAKPPALNLQQTEKLQRAASKYTQQVSSISAEVSRPIAPLQKLRQALKTRAGLRLTINDLLVLYRTIFNTYYRPGEALQKMMAPLKQQPGAHLLLQDLEAMFQARQEQNPSLLIPIDATRYDPKERIFPSTFRSPLPNFQSEHDKIMQLHEQATQRTLFNRRQNAADEFLIARAQYLGYLQAFSGLMQRYREIATSGESMGTTAIRLIAGLPGAMQQVMDNIPGQFTVVNEAIKGEEVFSNVGRVVAGSSLTRFSSAKDDNDKKVLVWGIMTNDSDDLVITLRDFRPPVLRLLASGYPELARHTTQDFLEAYIRGLYVFASEMEVVVTTSIGR